MAWGVTVGTRATGDGVTSLASNAPAGVTSGDLLVLSVCVATTTTITTPTGWTLRHSAADGFSACRTAVYERIATGGSDDTPTVGISVARDMKSVMLRITGHLAATPYGDSDVATQTSGATAALPNVDTSEAGCLLIGVVGADSDWGASPDPSGYTPRSVTDNDDDADIDAVLGVWTKEAGAAGTYGGETATMAASNQAVRIHLAYKPAAGGGGGGNPWWYRANEHAVTG